MANPQCNSTHVYKWEIKSRWNKIPQAKTASGNSINYIISSSQVVGIALSYKS